MPEKQPSPPQSAFPAGERSAPAAYDLLVVGELNADLILAGDVRLEFNQVEQLVESANGSPLYRLAMGSSAGIFACAAARLGLRVAFVGKIGADVFGRFLRDELEQRGIDTSGLVVDPHLATGLTVIFTRGADRAILTYPGAIPALRLDEIRWELVEKARCLHLASYFLLDALRPDVTELFGRARAAGLSISLDTNYDPHERWDGGLAQALPLVDVFLPNRTELLAIGSQLPDEGCPGETCSPGLEPLQSTSVETSGDTTGFSIAPNLIAKDPELCAALEHVAACLPVLAVKLGDAGGLACQSGQITHAAALPVQVADTVGAGDAFDAGFLYGYLNGWDLQRSLELACACGSLSTQQAGGVASQPSLSDALAALRLAGLTAH